jgi:pimeloyl-ACP methyl ester carboxylesterase
MTRLLLFLALTPALVLAQDQYFDSNGVRIRYVEQGSGEPVILIHGLSGDVERNWIDTGVLPTLVRNFRVIALDYRGHGKSGKLHDPKAYGMEMGRDVLRLMDHLKIARAHMVGYSLGGHIVAKLLTTNPERFLTATLGGSAGARRMISDEAIERVAADFAGETPMRLLILGFVPKGESPPDNDTIRRFLGGNDVAALAAVIRSWNGLVATEAQLNAVRVPTLALAGTADPVIEDLNALKRAWPSLKVITIDGGTHSNIIPAGRGTAARPEFVNAIRDFIAANKQ